MQINYSTLDVFYYIRSLYKCGYCLCNNICTQKYVYRDTYTQANTHTHTHYYLKTIQFFCLFFGHTMAYRNSWARNQICATVSPCTTAVAAVDP